MARCEAIAVRSGQQCQNEAVADGACAITQHQAQVAAARARAAAHTAPAESYGEGVTITLPAELHDVPAELPPGELEVMRELPRAADNVVDEIAAAIGSRASSADLGAFERDMKRHVDAAALETDDPGAVDAAAHEAADSEDAARADIRSVITSRGALRFKPRRVRWWLKAIVNPRFIRDGLEPLDDDELEEGAELAAEWLELIFGDRVQSLPGRTALWIGTVYGTRYIDPILEHSARAARWAYNRVRGMSSAERAAPLRRPVEQPAPSPGEQWDDIAGVGFGV